MAKSFKSQVKDDIRCKKLSLERSIKSGNPIWSIELDIEDIHKSYRQLEPRTKKEEQDFFNFICEHDQIIQKARKARIRFINHFLSNLQNEQEYFKTPENIKGLKMELEQLQEELNTVVL